MTERETEIAADLEFARTAYVNKYPHAYMYKNTYVNGPIPSDEAEHQSAALAENQQKFDEVGGCKYSSERKEFVEFAFCHLAAYDMVAVVARKWEPNSFFTDYQNCRTGTGFDPDDIWNSAADYAADLTHAIALELLRGANITFAPDLPDRKNAAENAAEMYRHASWSLYSPTENDGEYTYWSLGNANTANRLGFDYDYRGMQDTGIPASNRNWNFILDPKFPDGKILFGKKSVFPAKCGYIYRPIIPMLYSDPTASKVLDGRIFQHSRHYATAEFSPKPKKPTWRFLDQE